MLAMRRNSLGRESKEQGERNEERSLWRTQIDTNTERILGRMIFFCSFGLEFGGTQYVFEE